MSQRAYLGVPSLLITQPLFPDGVWKSFVPWTTIGVGAGVGLGDAVGAGVCGGNVPTASLCGAQLAKSRQDAIAASCLTSVTPAAVRAPPRASAVRPRRSTAAGGREVPSSRRG